MKKISILTFGLVLSALSCRQMPKKTADLILINGNIYTVDPENPRAEALALKGERILEVGSAKEIAKYQGDATEVVDLEGRFVMPGFIEGHGHFSGIGRSLIDLNFLRSESWDEIVAAVAKKVETAQPGEWIVGRGWHQEKWTKPPERQVLGYPYHDQLSEVSPDNPVLLRHASGHGSFANAKAMEMAGITAETPNPFGGEIVRGPRGEAIGVFEEKAQNLIGALYEEYLNSLSDQQLRERWLEGHRLAEQECLSKGITSFQDAGSSFQDIEWYRELAENHDLNLRLWVMLRQSSEQMEGRLGDLPIINAGDHYFTCRAVKSAVDGALGAFGAWLLQPYHDKPDFVGQNTVPIPEVRKKARLSIENGLQFCVHAIGDRANREVLNIYEELFEEFPDKKDLRWRIEHAQHLDTADIPRFKKLGVIASMQGIHCTSDAPFVVKRLGEERARLGAYPWRSLLDAGVVIANGTDAPVEDVDPLESIYASVTRTRADNGLVFFPEQRMTREEALHSYTLGNAYAAFEEEDKGSLEKGKLADFVVLSSDLITCLDEEILEAEVIKTYIGGKLKYSRD